MAHFAELNENNTVLRVLVTDNDDPSGDEGYQWLIDNFGGTWVKTSYNGNIRKNFAGIGFYYDEDRDAFIPPKPFSSWTLNETYCTWTPPVPYPNDSNFYLWDESTISWKEVTNGL
jgi:hypothetical protein